MGKGYCAIASSDFWHARYHDREYGFPIRSDRCLFERLALEINQAGLSWLAILKKRKGLRRAFEGFAPEVVARYGARERRRLLADAGIIRNRLKVDAVIENARRILLLRESHGSFARWLDAHSPSGGTSGASCSATPSFTGGEIVGEFLISTGYLPGAHERGCPIYARVEGRNPPWRKTLGAIGPRRRRPAP